MELESLNRGIENFRKPQKPQNELKFFIKELEFK